MSAIDEEIVREYFEQNGFLVRQVRKYQVQSRKKTSDEEIDLIVYNPTYKIRILRCTLCGHHDKVSAKSHGNDPCSICRGGTVCVDGQQRPYR